MSLVSSACCVVVLKQQQNLCYKNLCNEIPLDHIKPETKSCTVVENGRVVVKSLPINPTVAKDK